MDRIRIGDMVLDVTTVAEKIEGNPMTGNWKVYAATSDPDYVYKLEYRDFHEYEEKFERRDEV